MTVFFDLRQTDSLINLDSKGGLCIIGDQRYTQLLIDRACIHSMLPKRHGGIGEGYSKILATDAEYHCAFNQKGIPFVFVYYLTLIFKYFHCPIYFVSYQYHITNVSIPPIYKIVTIINIPVASTGIMKMYPSIANPITSIAIPGNRISFLNYYRWR